MPAFAAWPDALRQPASPATLAQPPALKLTFHPDHSVGANQACRARNRGIRHHLPGRLLLDLDSTLRYPPTN